MPTLTQQEPDTADLDFFYIHHAQSFGIALFEDEQENNLKAIPPNQEPTTCHTRTTRTNKATHFFRAPSTTSVVTCLCRKYHTKFISIQNNTYQPHKEFTQIAMGKRQNSKTVELINQISQTSDNIPPSPTPQLCQHTCPKCSKSITCRIYDNKHHPNESYILVDKKVYHTNCTAPLPTSSSSLSTTSSLNISSTIPNLEDSRKNLTSIFQNLQNTSQSSQENPQTTIFDSSIHTPSSAISTSTPLTQPIVFPTQSLANPLSNINTNKTFQTSETQSSVKHTYSSKLKSQTNPLSSTLGPLTSTETLQHSSMDIDNTSSDPTDSTFNDHTSKPTDLEEPIQPKRDTSNDFDWFKHYPITSEMENNTTLNTLGHQFFNFIKPLLIDFAPGKIVKTSTQNNNNKNQKEFKHTFKYLMASLAGKRPKFLLDLILEANPSLDKNSIVPFCIILDTFKSLFLQFTTELFTQLNYKKILSSLSSIPPYSIRNRNQVALNLARIHLFLQDKYQTIHAQKFIEELNIKPIRFKIHYSFSEDTPNKSLFQIQNDNKYNINVALNIPKQQFSQNFRIPSLKPFIQDLDKWFASFIPTYTRQFTNLSETTEKKIYNHIKHEVATTLATECKKLLPSSFNFPEITSLSERREAVAKATLHHIYNCNADKHACEILKTDTSNSESANQHTYQNIYQYYYKESLNLYPAPTPLSSSPKQSIIHPTLDYLIFEKNGTCFATFSKPFPAQTFSDLANEADNFYKLKNNAEPNIKRNTFYFYSYFNEYLKAAAKNDNIYNLSYDESLHKLLNQTTDPAFIGRVISYFEILKNPKQTFAQIRTQFTKNHLPHAEQLIINHYNIIKPNFTNALFYNPLLNKKDSISKQPQESQQSFH